MSEELKKLFRTNLYFNGVNGVTGKYALPPMPSKRLARLIQGKAEPGELEELLGEGKTAEEWPEKDKQREAESEGKHLSDLKWKAGQLAPFPVKEGVDPTSLEQAGWAVVFPAKMEEKRRKEIKGVLKPLLDRRRKQAGDKLFRIFEGGDGYRPGERKDQFFQRQKPEIKDGPADPTQMPFYVLLVGSPEEIPYEFQFQLDVMRGVGRIDFGDDLEAYARYAESVVLAESGKVKLPRRASFWGAANPGDKATQLSAKWLVQPLLDNLRQREIENEIVLQHDWQIDPFIGKDQATKQQLWRLLGGDPAQTPTLLFTASHGLEFPRGHKLQLDHQGALLCQEWGGPGSAIKEDYYFAGAHLAPEANLLGMMAVFFACYGAGTPRWDNFAKQAFKARAEIAPGAFIGALPRTLLSHGALAVIGHVERAWGYSFVAPGGSLDNQAFITTLRKLLNGEPVGLATDPSFNLRYADKAAALSVALEEEEWNPGTTSPYDLAYLWTSNNDARNYVVIGDPATRLPVAGTAKKPVRPQIEVLPFAVESSPVVEEAKPSPAERAAEAPQPAVPPEQAGGALTVSQAFTLRVSLIPQPAGVGPEAYTISPAATSFVALPWQREGETEEEKQDRKKLSEVIMTFFQNAAQAVAQAAKETATLEIVTYTSDEMANVKKEKVSDTAKLRALTRISATGDIELYVPQKDGAVDQALWAVHSEMVRQAQANRAELLKSVVQAVSGVVKVL